MEIWPAPLPEASTLRKHHPKTHIPSPSTGLSQSYNPVLVAMAVSIRLAVDSRISIGGAVIVSRTMH